MSTDWHVHCVDCKATHLFNDANHAVDLMLALIKHAPAIVALVPLLEASPDVFFGGGYAGRYGTIDAAWFATHAGHKLRPINEYGDLLDQCRERIVCGECRESHRKCVLDDGHDGPHIPVAP